MKRNEAIAVLYEATGCQLIEIEPACHELESGGHIAEPGEDWAAEDCAIAFLRVLAQNVPLNEFINDIAYADLAELVLIEDDGDGVQKVTGDGLAENAYSAAMAHHSLVETLADHIRAVAYGHANLATYPLLAGVNVYQASDGYSAAITARFAGAGFKHAATAVWVYGKARVYNTGRQLGISPDALDALGRALKESVPDSPSLPAGPVERTTQSGETLH